MPYKDKEQQKKYAREWVAQRRAAYFKNKVCVLCGGTQDLQLDHIHRGDKVSHSIWSWSQIRRDAELSKCQILCKECQQQKTINELYTPRRHGTVIMYDKGGCRCSECTRANTVKSQNYRKRV